ncbi:MAG: hypothetical protein NZ930_04590 [Candidatus Bipolaricaulota bacterium]|nr:hypothetical protein [Candidatus Bipolaricaulota bacterium]MDW8030589.1 hypothetical protein [Candidatus Bipolaricaulota bacterium]
MARALSIVLGIILGMGGYAHAAVAQEPSPDLSQDRTLGIGLQAPCIFSFRYWLTEGFALELNGFVISIGDFTSGCVASKMLARLADTGVFDFYVIFEGNLHIGEYWGEPSVGDIALKAGMELSVLPSLAINLEFGEAVFFGPAGVSASPAISLGLHYYFTRAPQPKPAE